MKRMFTGLLLSLSLLMALTGCSGDKDSPTGTGSPSPSASPSENIQRSIEDGLDRAGNDMRNAADDIKNDFDRMVEDGKVN